jgi:hypothetical protein
MKDCSSNDCRPFSPRDIERDSQRLYRWIKSIEAQRTNVMVDELYYTSEVSVDYLNVRVKNFIDKACELNLYLCDEDLNILSQEPYNDILDGDYGYYKVALNPGAAYVVLSYNILSIPGTSITPSECEFIYPISNSSGPSPSGKELANLTLNTNISKIVFNESIPSFVAAELDGYLTTTGNRTGWRLRFLTSPVTIGIGNFIDEQQTSYNTIYQNGTWSQTPYQDTYYTWEPNTRTFTPKTYFTVNKANGLPLVTGLGKYY